MRTGARFGLELDPARWSQAERAAYRAAAARREETGLVHDDGLLAVIANAIIAGLGGGPAGAVELTARAIIAAWSDVENFGLYDDVLPCLDALRAAGVRMALLSNALGHGVEEIVAHFALDEYMAAAVSSVETGAVKPAPRMFSTLFGLLGVSPADAVMVGDSVEDDVTGRHRLRLPGDPAGPLRTAPGPHGPAHPVAGRVACGARPLSKRYLTSCRLRFTLRDVKQT